MICNLFERFFEVLEITFVFISYILEPLARYEKMIFYTVNVILTVAGKIDLDNALLLYYEKKRGESNLHHACVIVYCTELLRILLAISDQLALKRLILNLLFLSAVVFIARLCFLLTFI